MACCVSDRCHYCCLGRGQRSSVGVVTITGAVAFRSGVVIDGYGLIEPSVVGGSIRLFGLIKPLTHRS